GGIGPHSAAVAGRLSGPEIRMTATPEGRAPDDSATIVEVSIWCPPIPLVKPREQPRRYVFIESKNSLLDLVWRSLSSKNSIASTVPMGLRIRRRTYILRKISGSTRS